MANIVYVDASMPDDTGDGLTQGTAKRTPRAANLIVTAGGKILIKTGYYYDPLGGLFVFFTGVSNVEVGTYGTASEKPILDGLTYQNPNVGGWTYISDGVWKKKFAATFIKRLWTDSYNNGFLVTQRKLGTAYRRSTGLHLTGTAANPSEAEIIASLTPRDIWFGAGATPTTPTSDPWAFSLYMYTGSSTIDPPTYYNGLAFIQGDAATVGAVTAFHIENQTGIYIHDIHAHGNSGTGFRFAGQNSNTRNVANCLIEDCIVTAPYNGAFVSRLAGQLSPTARLTNSTVRRVYADYMSSGAEQEPSVDYNNLSGICDMFNIADGSVGITVEGCTAINGAHNGLVVGSTAMRTTPPSGCRVLNNTVIFDTWHTYGRGISTFDGTAIVQGNLIIGQNTRSQLSGSATIVGNVWKGLRSSIRKANVSQWVATESYIYANPFGTSLGNEGFLKIAPDNLVIANNVCYSPPDTAIQFNFYSNGVGSNDNTWGNVTVENNVIVGMPGQFLTTYEEGAKSITQAVIANNCTHNRVVGDNKITWKGTPYTINAAPGSSGNKEEDPNLDSNHRPLNANLRGAGVAIVGRDFYGKDLLTTPSIGAVEVRIGARSKEPRASTIRTTITRKIIRRDTTA